MLCIHTGNRLESLRDALAARLAAPAGGDPLAEECIVTERGVDRWLCQSLARAHGIAANIRCEPPGTFLWRAMRACVGRPREEHPDADEDPWARDVLALRILRLLPPLLGEACFAPVRDWLGDDAGSGGQAAGARRVQLATRLASTFDDYLVYRPDVLLDWQRGRELPALGETGRWQQRLWQALVDDGGDEHRATLMQRFVAQVDAGGMRWHAHLPVRVAVFGIPALPPAYIAVLERLARLVEVDLYVLSPSAEYWGEMLAPATMARINAETGYAFDTPNRLLAANGQPVRHFLAGLHEAGMDADEHFTDPGDATVLARLQSDVLALTERTGGTPREIDGSVRIAAAWGPMREVEALHDTLLALFNADPTLAADDVIVMAPDIAAWAPCLDAVFGAATGTRHIPYTVADAPLRGAHPVAIAFESLLRLPESRLAVNDVLALLDVPAVAARLGLGGDDVARLRRALLEANVRWGEDAAERVRLGLPSDATHSWQFAFDRLFMGLVAGTPGSTVLGVAPVASFTGQDSAVLGRLREFVATLSAWRTRLAGALTIPAWTARTAQLLETFLAPVDAGSERAIAAITDTLRDMTRAALAAGCEVDIDAPAFRDALLARLQPGDAARGGFLAGAVTCCALVPMRSLPFRVVALLGMDAAAFPRREPRNGFDLVDLHPRAGDRARRLDDRHLFLEALLSARDVFYLSYTARDARDNGVREPAVPVGELIDLVVAMHGGEASRADVLARLVTEFPLQPFSRRHFDGVDPQLASFDADWLAAARAQARPTETKRFCTAPLAAAAGAGGPVSLAALASFCARPVQAFLRERLGVVPAREEAQADDDEPFAVGGIEGWQLAEDWTAARLDGRGDSDSCALFAARGLLPYGAFGEAPLREGKAVVDSLCTRIAPESGTARTIRIDLRLGGESRSLSGVVRTRGRRGVLRWTASSRIAARALSLWVEHLALCAQGGDDIGWPGDAGPVSCLVAPDEQIVLAPLTPDAARARLLDLLHLYDEGLCEPLPFFARSAWDFATTRRKGKDGARAARATWQGGDGEHAPPGEHADREHAIAFTHLDDPCAGADGERFVQLVARVLEPLLDAVAAAAQGPEGARA